MEDKNEEEEENKDKVLELMSNPEKKRVHMMDPSLSASPTTSQMSLFHKAKTAAMSRISGLATRLRLDLYKTF